MESEDYKINQIMAGFAGSLEDDDTVEEVLSAMVHYMVCQAVILEISKEDFFNMLTIAFDRAWEERGKHSKFVKTYVLNERKNIRDKT